MDVLTAVLGILVAIAILFEIARRVGVPFPTLFVLGGLGLAFVPGLPRFKLEPDLILLVFLPPLLFSAASDSPSREILKGRKYSSKNAFALAPSEMSAALAARQGSRNEMPNALGSAGGFRCAATGVQLVRNAL